MGFEESFRFSKSKLLFVFILLFIILVLILFLQYVLVGEKYAWSLWKIIIYFLLWVVSFPASLFISILFKPFGFLPYIMDGSYYNFFGYILILVIDFVFWYLVACVFVWLNRVTTNKSELA